MALGEVSLASECTRRGLERLVMGCAAVSSASVECGQPRSVTWRLFRFHVLGNHILLPA